GLRSRTADGPPRRATRRASLDQFWTTQTVHDQALIALGASPQLVKSDGADLWVTDQTDDLITRVRGSDGKFLENWTGGINPRGLLLAIALISPSANPSPLPL